MGCVLHFGFVQHKLLFVDRVHVGIRRGQRLDYAHK